MAGTSLFFDLMARDHASAVFNKVGAAADQLGKRTDRAGKSHQAFGKAVRWAGGMLSVYGIGQYLKSSVQEYANAEAAQNKLANSYRRFPAMQNVALRSFKDLNTQLMLHTQFDDDDAAAMQANMARFELTGRQVQKLTPLVADLAQVQGTDLVTAGDRMAKAFLGNTRALKQLGINYTATGNRAKDMRNIIRLVNEKVGGESAKAAGTTAVKLKMLENQWGELKETVGAAVLPAFSKLVEVAGPGIQNFASAVERNGPQIAATFDDIWTAASKLGHLGKSMWDGFSSIPEGTRQLLLALAGGTWAFGKVKSSGLGQGISGIFSGIRTITAGNVTVIGKSVTGGGAGIGKTGFAGALAMLGSAAFVSAVTVAAGAAYYKLANPEPKRVSQGGNPTTYAGGYGSDRTIHTSEPQYTPDYKRGLDAQSARQTAKALAEMQLSASGAADAAMRFVWQYKLAPKHVKETARDANEVAAAVLKASQNKTARITIKGAKEAAADAEDVAKRMRKIINRDARISAKGAKEAAADATDVAAKLKKIVNRTAKVSTPGAKQSIADVGNLRGEISGMRGKTVKVGVDNAQAVAALAQVTAALALVQSKTITITQRTVKGQAGGGLIRGPGTSTSDSIPTMLSDGEYVIRASAVAKYGHGFMDLVNSGRLSGFKKGGSPWPKLPKKPGKDATDAQKQAYDRAVTNLKAAKAAAADAAWQKNLAKIVKEWSLSDGVASWLGGLDKGAVKTLLANPKGRAAGINRIKALAGKSGAMGNRSDLSAANSEWTAWINDQRWANNSPAQNIADAQSKIAEAKAAGSKPKASAKERAKALRDEIEWTQKLQQAQEEQAQAQEEQAQAERDAQDAALDKANQLRDAVEGLAAGYRSFASISTTSVNDVTDAQSKLSDANDAVAAAQKKMDLAGSDRERAAAAAELAKALKDQQSAQQGVNEAGKPTSGSIRGNMASRLAKIRSFSADVKKLKDLGLNATTLADILQMGPEQGDDFAKALIDGGLGDINDLQNQITAESASLGYTQYATNAASDQLTGAAAAAQIGVTITPAPVTLTLDGQVIAQAMQAYNRQMGR